VKEFVAVTMKRRKTSGRMPGSFAHFDFIIAAIPPVVIGWKS
jgi:hypothetical protein